MGKYMKLKDFDLQFDELKEKSSEQSFSHFIEHYNDVETLKAELTRLGHPPGPIVNSTKSVYLKKLYKLKKNEALNELPARVCKQKKTYNRELEKSFPSDEWFKNLSPYKELERQIRLEFDDDNRQWPNGNCKTSFTYLLLDPRLTNNLPTKAGKQIKHQMWNTFVNSIFYVGKGTRSRPYAHLYDAKKFWNDAKPTHDKKVQHILDIWDNNLGVICIKIFQNIIPAEALTYEAAMIDAIGLSTLTNLKRGTYKGTIETWPSTEKKMLGQYLLYKAMQIFIIEGERQLRPDDI